MLQNTFFGAGGNDGLDRDHQAFGEASTRLAIVEIWNTGVLVDAASDTVATQSAHHTKAAASGFFFDRAADLVNAIPGSRYSRGLLECCLRTTGQGGARFTNFAHSDCYRSVGIESVLLRDQIKLHKIAG